MCVLHYFLFRAISRCSKTDHSKTDTIYIIYGYHDLFQQLMQQEVYDMRSKMKQYEAEMRKIHHLMNRVAELENHLRIRCRSAIPINSGSLNF